MTPGDWATFPKPNPRARLRLFCFPYAGGGATAFRAWPAGLPPEVELCAVQLPGRENRLREAPLTQLAPLLDALTVGLAPYGEAPEEMPFAFFGHSLGALVAFELARRLAAPTSPPAAPSRGPLALWVSAHRAPQLPSLDAPIHDLPEAEFVQALRSLNGTPEEVLQHAELMELLLPVLRADFSVYETHRYVAGEPLACPIIALGGLQDKMVSRDDLAAWRVQTRGAFSLRMFPGDHFFLHSARNLLLQSLSRDLAALLATRQF